MIEYYWFKVIGNCKTQKKTHLKSTLIVYLNMCVFPKQSNKKKEREYNL